MKSILRSAFFQGVMAAILAGWLRFCFATMRWTVENLPAAEAGWSSGGGVIVCFWHSRIALSPRCWPLDGRAQEPRALISLSADGEFIAGAVAKLGFPAIRGSSTKKAAWGDKAKGGTTAFRDALRWVRGGGGIAITPDGPRGPVEQMAEGAILLARVSKAPVMMVGFAAEPSIKLASWDTAVVPLPFSRGAIVWGDLLSAEDVEDTEAARAEWAARLSALTRRAEALVS